MQGVSWAVARDTAVPYLIELSGISPRAPQGWACHKRVVILSQLPSQAYVRLPPHESALLPIHYAAFNYLAVPEELSRVSHVHTKRVLLDRNSAAIWGEVKRLNPRILGDIWRLSKQKIFSVCGLHFVVVSPEERGLC